MMNLLQAGIASVLLACAASCGAVEQSERSPVRVSGEWKTWHNVVLTVDGPELSEDGTPNPFLDCRLDATFSMGDQSFRVPGYFAADGDAAETGAASGGKWRVHFAPPAPGEWSYRISFRTGEGIAVSDDPQAGSPAAADGFEGAFRVLLTDKTGRDFRGKGMLEYTGERYLRFAGSGEWFLKGGADSPENFLAYEDFDNTLAGKSILHTYAPHAGDWREGDPTWRGGKGKNIIGALNYLSGKGMNSVYFLTMNVNGDGDDVFPWTDKSERFRFDCSKLDQWETVFSHMDRLGLMMHVILQEQENDQLLDGGELGPERRLYQRELIARFAHHPALVWNLGEENTNTAEQAAAFARYFKSHDPYRHPVVIHTHPTKRDLVYAPLLGCEALDGPSYQTGPDSTIVHDETRRWLRLSAENGHQWFVCIDEPGGAARGCDHDTRDPNNQADLRRHALWGNLMAGGAGVEWYFGYQNPHNDLQCEDWRSRDRMWDYTRFALEFFQRELPFAEMESRNELLSGAEGWCFAKPGEIYVVYLINGGAARLDLNESPGEHEVWWLDPRNGGELKRGTIQGVSGPGVVDVGLPPEAIGEDWAAAVVRK